MNLVSIAISGVAWKHPGKLRPNRVGFNSLMAQSGLLVVRRLEFSVRRHSRRTSDLLVPGHRYL